MDPDPGVKNFDKKSVKTNRNLSVSHLMTSPQSPVS
jgi:hypothetical protein